jgi:hypothetical protein
MEENNREDDTFQSKDDEFDPEETSKQLEGAEKSNEPARINNIVNKIPNF